MTRKILSFLAGAAALAAIPAQASGPAREGELARALEGRVAGQPVNCIDLRQVRSSRTINDTALLYEVGNTIYVNRPSAGAESLDQWSTQIVRPFAGSRLCSLDTMDLVDRASGVFEGVVFLGEFVPYRRAAHRD